MHIIIRFENSIKLFAYLFHNLITSGMLPKIKNMHVQFHAFAENSYIKYLAIKQEMSKTHDVVLDSLWKWTFWTRKDSND